MFKVEAGVPFPKRRGGPGAKRKYPFNEMAAGDSFYVPANGEPLIKVANRIRNAAQNYRKRGGAGFKFSARQDGGGVRLFCLASRGGAK